MLWDVVHIDDQQRRARLALRHALARDAQAGSVEEATRALTVLHATDSSTIYLALAARVPGLSPADVDRALYEKRSVIRQMAMRRTLFGVPVELMPAVVGSAGHRLVGQQRRAIARDVEKAGLSADGDAWVQTAEAAVSRLLADGGEFTAPQIRELLPEVAGTIDYAPGKSYGGAQPIAPRVLTAMSAHGSIVRARQHHHWRLNRPTWQSMESWIGAPLEPVTEQQGYAELVGAWLRSFGPGTEEDLVWWLGSTKAAVRRALADVEALTVTLDGGATGWVLPDDLAPTPEVEPWVALLPSLDPTTMGWKGRGFYLDERQPRYFDRVGNAGATAWLDGRVVGTWIQDADGVVRVHLDEAVPAWAQRAFRAEAERLSAWCEGVRISSIWVSPAMAEAAKAL
ncbi:winged helix DNA-binding domain-containing protein [Nocardioides dubius]|uniref:Winged helix DNA-binding domain-containing protein n=1 Tax=Nocardioides dubius TaxID=317019 RepID=A0ABP4EN35_9ACTN